VHPAVWLPSTYREISFALGKYFIAESHGSPRRTEEDLMKHFPIFCVVVLMFLFLVAPAVRAQSGSDQIVPGTQVHLSLATGISTRVARDGDPFTATVTEPAFVGNQLVLPAGAKIHGTVKSVTRPKLFSMFRGGASMNLVFDSIEVESRIFPARMSILSIYSGSTDAGKQRKDLNTVEGVVVEQRHDVKTEVEDVAIGTAGGSLAGIIFSRVVRGTVIGLVGGSAYVVAKKGNDVELPAQTGMVVRMDSTVALPSSLLHNASYSSSSGN
jgi:hypothetical protein